VDTGSQDTVASVDLPMFMGDWYVVGIIPNFIEKDAVNAVESYSLNKDGNIDINYTFREKKPDGKVKKMTATGFVHNLKTNSEWRVQFLKPFKLPYLIIDLDSAYKYTVIGVPKRNYAWIMSRTPRIEDPVWEGIIGRMKSKGYDIAKIRKVPQIWP
jgi:apolipoprotein D and lipocalin family protein